MIESCEIAISDSRLAVIRSKVAAYDWDQLPDAGNPASAKATSSDCWITGSTNSTGVKSKGV
jgi:hypothetical protein